MFNKNGWRERAKVVAIVALYLAAGVFVTADLLFHQPQLSRFGLFLLSAAGIWTVVWCIDRRLGRAFDTGERSGRRHARLDTLAGEPQLAVVRDLARPR